MASEKVNRIQAALNLGVEPHQIDKWCELGAPYEVGDKKRNNRFDCGELFQWRIAYERETLDGDKVTLSEAKRRKELALAQKAELDVAVQRGQLVKIEDLMLEFSDALTKVRASLISMPARLAGDLSHRSDTEVSKLLESDITTTLEHLSNYDHANIT